MGKKFNFGSESNAYLMSEDIKETFKKFSVRIDIADWKCLEDRVRFEVTLKGGTTGANFFKHIQDVQDRLRLPLFQAYEKEHVLYIVASEKHIEYPRLPDILDDPPKQVKKAVLPYIVGHNVLGQISVIDLSESPHMLVGGSTGSGKTIGLRALITSIAWWKTPDDVNFILIDVGAGGLAEFEELPHLSHPVIHDRETALRALAALKTEMERRVALGPDSQDARNPRLVVVIDEFPALFMGETDKKISKTFADTISSLLQRGRHAGIHLVLAAQNPTYQNMKVDLSNLTTRVAFRCAKKNFSETILGEGGAENLSGQGELLLKAPRCSGLQRIQGTYIKPRELRVAVQQIKYYSYPSTNKFNLILPDLDPAGEAAPQVSQLSCSVVRNRPSRADQLLANVIVWVLEQEKISTNRVMHKFPIGWNKAAELVKRMADLGIVGRPKGKLPREVVPAYPEDLPEELIIFLQNAGYSQDAIIDAFCKRLEK